jgi:3-dehydroquinate synthase class II
VGLSRALELGVDALCVKCNVSNEFFASVLAAKAERAAAPDTGTLESQEPQIIRGTCYRIPKKAVLADRVCVDLVQTLQSEEGCWIGFSAKLAALVLSEAATSSLIPSRPFRVNAEPVHSYILMGDGKTTKYLCELEAGDEVCVYNHKLIEGGCRW